MLGVTATQNDTTMTLSKTWQEIYDTMDNGGFVVVYLKTEGNIELGGAVQQINVSDKGYVVTIQNLIFSCDSSEAYPSRPINSNS